MSRPLLIKLGGSIVTDKSKEQSYRRPVARRLLSEIAKGDAPVVLFHGAGSFGHPQAKKWKLNEGAIAGAKLEGVSATLASVALLHGEILQAAAEAGLRPVSVPVHAMCEATDGMLDGLPFELMEELLHAGFTPVLCGTMVRDGNRGWSIVSADQMMALAAGELNPRLAVFVTDVEGVLDGNGTLLPEIRTVGDVGRLADAGADVTGSMRAKVAAALEVAGACPTVILNGMERGRLLDALKGKPVPGTRPLP